MHISTLYLSCDRARAVARFPDLATRRTEGLHFLHSRTHALGDSSWRQETFGQAFRRGRRPASSVVRRSGGVGDPRPAWSGVPAGSETRVQRGQRSGGVRDPRPARSAFRRGRRLAPSAMALSRPPEAKVPSRTSRFLGTSSCRMRGAAFRVVQSPHSPVPPRSARWRCSPSAPGNRP